MEYEKGGKDIEGRGGTHWSEVLREDALGFFEDSKKHDQPFFMYVAFNAAHDPRQAPKEYVDMYPLEMADISDNPSHSPKLKYFFNELRDLQRVKGDPLDLIADYP